MRKAGGVVVSAAVELEVVVNFNVQVWVGKMTYECAMNSPYRSVSCTSQAELHVIIEDALLQN